MEPSRFRGGEGHGRRPRPGVGAQDHPAYWEWNDRKAVLGTGETRLGPATMRRERARR